MSHHGGNGVEAELYERINAQILWWSQAASEARGYLDESSERTYVQNNIQWMKNTQWLYIITGRSLQYATGHSCNSNPTVTITRDGIVGLPIVLADVTETELEYYANLFIGDVQNAYPGYKSTYFVYGNGYFNYSNGADPTYSGDGVILWRGNFRYAYPVASFLFS